MKTQQLKNEEFVRKLFKILYDGSLNNTDKEGLIEYIVGYFSGMSNISNERMKVLRKEVKQAEKKLTEIDIQELIFKFLGNDKMENIKYDDEARGIHFSVELDKCMYTMTLKYSNHSDGTDLNLIKRINGF